MFPPALEDSEDTCQINEQNDLKLQNPGSHEPRSFPDVSSPLPALRVTTGVDLLTDGSHNKRVAPNRVSASSIVPRNTSLPKESLSHTSRKIGISHSPLESPHVPSIFSDTASVTSSMNTTSVSEGRGSKDRDYSYVSMTPLIAPGDSYRSGEMTPIMTYGIIFSIPIILDPSPIHPSHDSHSKMITQLSNKNTNNNSSSSSYNIGFEILPGSQREAIARDLDSTWRKRRLNRNGSAEGPDVGDDTWSLSTSGLATKQSIKSHGGASRSSQRTKMSLRHVNSRLSAAGKELVSRLSAKTNRDSIQPFGGQISSLSSF
jgi:hypothetical protein